MLVTCRTVNAPFQNSTVRRLREAEGAALNNNLRVRRSVLMAIIKYSGYKGCTPIAREHAGGWAVEIVSRTLEKKLQTTTCRALSDAIGEAHKLVDCLHSTDAL